jgi:methionine-rich copper-binding protein CopC
MRDVLTRALVLGFVLVAVAAALPAPALAHAELVSSDPADGEVMAEPPTEIVITFDGELVPAGSGFRLAGPGGEVGVGSVDLEVAERNVLRGDASITAPGIYTVKWTVLGEDGHEQLGDFTFTVGSGDVPETALAAPFEPMRLALALAGAAMLVTAAVVVIARLSTA